MEILQQIDSGALSAEAALAEHGLSTEELALWRENFKAFGKRGLRTTQVQLYRRIQLYRGTRATQRGRDG
jgi:hypothetical protein